MLAAPPRIAYDEWNVWYRQMTGALEERYTFADALAVGTYLNIFTRKLRLGADGQPGADGERHRAHRHQPRGPAVQPTWLSGAAAQPGRPLTWAWTCT